MSVDYIVSSLPALQFDAPAPIEWEKFVEACGGKVPECDKWRDLETQLRNASAAERARLAGQDPAKWRRPAAGCALYWTNRVTAAFQEKDPAKRERLLDQVRWDAAGELTPAASPLSAAAAFTYAIRLAISIRRSALVAEAGNEVFNRLTAATAPGSDLKG
jgi:hypothetical protein